MFMALFQSYLAFFGGGGAGGGGTSVVPLRYCRMTKYYKIQEVKIAIT